MMKNENGIIPKEFLEFNPRLWALVILIAVGSLALVLFPVKKYMGYIDPFYSPTVLIIPIIGLFRLTCYAYRGEYNKHVFKHPLACPARSDLDNQARAYTGETSLLMKIQNLHRYFMYFALLILPFFYYDIIVSMTYAGGITLRLGSLFLIANAVLLTLYTLSCHSVRSLLGGRDRCLSCKVGGSVRQDIYNKQSALNRHHMLIAWLSLFSIIAVDLYLRALAAGWRIDFIIFHLV